MRIYVEAYDGFGKQILGNLDGQLSWEGKNYKRMKWYKNLSNVKTLNGRVQHYKIVNETGQILETVRSKTYQKPNGEKK